MSGKERIDTLLVSMGHFESRQRAQQSIMAGEVFVNGQRVDKAGTAVSIDVKIEIKGNSCPYVSRGGLKLERAMSAFCIDLSGRVCMDVGASTGGFTDCMLQNGAKKVYSIDVGYGQLAWKLRIDERVVNLERTNVRKLTKEEVPELIEFASIDVSFISLRLVLPVVKWFLRDGGSIVALIKPQFEAGKGMVGKNGVVREMQIHQSVIDDILFFCTENNLTPAGLTYSPIKGPMGNIEFLLYINHNGAAEQIDAKRVVEAAHKDLNGEQI